MDETWVNMMNTLQSTCKSHYLISQISSLSNHPEFTICIQYGKSEIITAWKLYYWLQEQMKSNDEQIQNNIIAFMRNAENQLFVLGFILSGFAENLHAVYRLHIKELIVEIAQIYKYKHRFLDLPQLNRFNNTEMSYIMVNKQNEMMKSAKIRIDYLIAKFNYKMTICKHFTHTEREGIMKLISAINQQFRECVGAMMHIYPRKTWYDFLNSQLFTSFKNKENNNHLPSIIKYLLELIEYANEVPRLRDKIKMYVDYHDHNYEKEIFEMACESDRKLWLEFKQSQPYLNFVSLCENNVNCKISCSRACIGKHEIKTKRKRKGEVEPDECEERSLQYVLKTPIEIPIIAKSVFNHKHYPMCDVPICECITEYNPCENELDVIGTINDLLFEEQIRNILINIKT